MTSATDQQRAAPTTPEDERALARPLRILFVTPRYPPFTGGVEMHTREVARRLVQAGLDVTVLTTNPGGRLPRAEQVDGIRVVRERAWPASRDYYIAPGIYDSIRNGDWDLVHCQGYHTLVPPIAMLAAWRSGKPYFVTFHSGGHSSRFRQAVRGLQRLLLRPLLARAAKLIAVSNYEAELFRSSLHLPAEQFVVVANGSHLPAPSISPTPASSGDGPLLLSVGRLERYKGHHRVIEAMPLVASVRQDVQLLIVGSGPFEDELKRLVTALRVEEHVKFVSVPASDRQQMADLYAQAALVVLLSDYEAHPLSVIEARALGRPVLVTDTSGLAELADRGIAHAIPLSSSPDQIAEAIIKQLDQPASPVPVTLPTWEECTDHLLSLYQASARGRSCAS